MSEKTRVALRVEESKRDEWEAFVEESSHYESLSQLIRTTVTNEVRSDDDDDAENGYSEADFDRLDNRLSEMESTLSEIRDGIYAEEEAYDLPPSGDPNENASMDLPRDDVFVLIPDGDGPDDGETAAEMAEGTGYNEWVVSETANVLYHDSGRVKRHDNDETRYWKEL